ncbi:hypothetical protein TSO221_25640 [Azospirillum sp. TSO22-1]|nr:hypothetical protein TSO221_25640 [Azospirillum sp. TSO22-1]
MRLTRAFVVFYGPHGLGNTQEWEISVALQRAQAEGIRLIPALLPDARDDRLLMIKTLNPIIFVSASDEDEPISQIVRTIKPRRRPAASAAPPTGDVNLVHDAMEYIRMSGARNGRLNLVFGPHSTLQGQDGPPGPWDLSKLFLSQFGVVSPEHDGLLPSLDISGGYVEARQGLGALEEFLIERMLRAQPSEVLVYAEVARLVRGVINGITAPRPRRETPLLFNLNVDTLLESALLFRQVPFTRVVVNLQNRRLYATAFEAVRLDEGRFRITAAAAGRSETVTGHPRDFANLFASLPQEEYAPTLPHQSYGHGNVRLVGDLSFASVQGCVLFKYHGSYDIPNTVAMTTKQYFELSAAQDLIPPRIREWLSTRPTLVFGCSVLCSTFHQAYSSLLKESFEQGGMLRRYTFLDRGVLLNDPNWRLDGTLKDIVMQFSRFGIQMLDVSPDLFLQTLTDELHGHGGNA